MDVIEDITPSDGMLEPSANGREHYFSVGKSALNVIEAALRLAGVGQPKSILDFGCGAGRVTRWLCAGFQGLEISACDLRETDLIFVRRTFGVRTWASYPDVAVLQTPRQFDLIWAGSVLTHLNEKSSEAMLWKLMTWLEPKGLLVASLHGRTARDFGDRRIVPYHEAKWPMITRQCDVRGYGYADCPGQKSYGISLCTPGWIVRTAESIAGARIVLFGEALWADHHDVIALQR
jgi:SAM-dependent methyltransferase